MFLKVFKGNMYMEPVRQNGYKDISNIFENKIIELLKRIANDEGFSDYKIEKTDASAKGDGYLGVITMVEIKNTSTFEQKTLNLVVKSARKSSALREKMPINDVFKQEIYMYNSVLPALQQFLIEKHLPRFPSFAKYYDAITIFNSEALILENLKTKGFRLWERKIPMDEEHVSLVMKEYGRFHALSFALQDQEPIVSANLIDNLDKMFNKMFGKDSFLNILINECKKVAVTLSWNDDLHSLSVFKEFIETAPAFIQRRAELSNNYSAILHGDCWTNNMMFGYDVASKPNSPTKMCFIDLQLANMGPPVFDLAYYFYCCSSSAIIDNVQYYLDLYYNSLDDYLETLGSKASQVYPRPVFLKQWKEHARFGLLMSIMLIRIMMSEENEVADISDLAESGKTFEDSFNYTISNFEEYNKRVKHIILHFVNNNLI